MKKNEIAHAKEVLAEIAYEFNFISQNTSRNIRLLTKEGFSIVGRIGARFTVEDGLILRNKTQDHGGLEFTLKDLNKMDKALRAAFEEVVLKI